MINITTLSVPDAILTMVLGAIFIGVFVGIVLAGLLALDDKINKRSKS